MPDEKKPNYEKDFVHIAETMPKPIAPVDMQATTASRGGLKKRNPIVRFSIWLFVLVFMSAVAGGVFVYKTLVTPVGTASENALVVVDIPKGANLDVITERLEYSGVVTSATVFRLVMLVTSREASVKSGEYTFRRPMTMLETIEKLVQGKYEYTPVKLTIKEGEDSRSIATTIATKFFSKESEGDISFILAKLREKEGKLFPETYSFAPFSTLDEILKTIDKEFDKRFEKYRAAVASSTYSEIEILTIASILEKEVPRPGDMKIVAGIIYNRLKKGMPLQMDSTLGYITGKASLELTTEDLKMDSPYNTYVMKGIPPAPIGNPGDAAIRAALYPESHEYLFFLSDKSGDNHYAKTYAEHLRNRKVYLGK